MTLMQNNDPKPTTELAGNKQEEIRDDTGKYKPGISGNPSGKGGFGDRPEDINKGGKPKDEVSIVHYIKEYLKGKEEGHEKERAQELAEKIVTMAYSDGNVIMIREVLERIEGKTPWKIESNIGDSLTLVANTLDEIIKGHGETKPTDPTDGSTNPSDQANR